MSKPAGKIATYQDLFELPDHLVGEIMAGALITHPRPAPKHALAASVIGAKLLTEFHTKPDGEDGDWWILDKPECHLAEDIVVPDIAGWRKATIPELPENAWFPLRPDWVCEVLSPATAKYVRGIKREVYAREGVSHYWIVAPIEKMIEVFELQNGSWLLLEAVSDDTVATLPPFVSMPFDLAKLWV